VIGRGVGAPAIAALVGSAVLATFGAPAAAQDSDVVELLERFRPTVAMREQSEPCGEGEPYFPVAVDAIFGLDEVVLRDGDGDVIVTAPTASDLAGGGEDLAIDLPGNALDPGCSYEEWFDGLGADPAVYGRVVVDGDQVVAQYWLYWVYNDWNDRHEGDWEMIQLVFDAATPAEALATTPQVYAFAQHEGSEYARVGDNDAKLELDSAGAPVVFPGEGSHAAYFSSSRWFGKSGATGFGCDDTRDPLVRVRPDVIVMPDVVPTDGEFAWLSFAGHWGERQPMFNDGPTGPVSKDQWDAPVEWVEQEGRSDAVAIPFAGSDATDAFCNLSEKGSLLFLRLLDEPWRALVLVVVVIAAVVAIVRYSSRGLLGRAARTWREQASRMIPTGAWVLLAAAGSVLVQQALLRLTPLGDLVDVVGSSSAWVLPLVTVVGAVVSIPIVSWVVAATITPAEDGQRPRSMLRTGSARRAATLATLAVLVIVGSLTAILLLPIAAIIVSRLLLTAPVCAHERVGAGAAMGRSHRLVRGHGWRALGLVLTMGLVAAVAGVVGALVLVLTSATFFVAGVVAALVGVVVVPYLALVLDHFYAEVVAT
jgi:hypothetical protein